MEFRWMLTSFSFHRNTFIHLICISLNGEACNASKAQRGWDENEGKQMTWPQRSSIINTWSRW